MSATDQDVSRDRTADAESEAETETDGDNPPSVADLPPSAKLVYKVLEYEGSMTQEEIAAESRLCSRTVRYALGKLEDDFVTSRVCLEDARQSKYTIGN
ncbi:MarR family transcriptional regulator [Natronolimnobius baerhuensis]|uniref:MarR family transcriptional regulator n=1 Tax=Natronolimnobius baerhuensis TaxID=253108 RepID=A0A202ECJ5_9EURY|nr:MarR family transcriptional regulator [Natronolimnobius baerhuensis]OVE86003.1 MarR family transcriptional regulator [Natronolimnobius baerhuensis]